jgi:site-specific recombinase XerD
MFDQLFTRQTTIARHRTAPYSAERERYLQHLSSQHYSRTSLERTAHGLLAIVLQTDLACRRFVSGCDIREAVRSRRSLRQGRHKRSSVHTREDLRRTATAWLGFLGKMVPDSAPATPVAPIVEQFETFLRDERGLAESTTEHYSWHAREFLEQLARSGRSLRHVRLEDVDSYMAARAESGWRRSSMPAVAGAVRSFLRFGELRRLSTPGLAVGVSAPRMYTDERLPEGLEWRTVSRLLASTRGNASSDIRDRAILFLLSIYGLRCCEIESLRLDDIDWHNGTVSIRRPKQRHTQQYPLEATTGQALLRYIRDARPRTECRHVFLNLIAPTRAITRISIYNAVRKRVRALGLQGSRRGPHALRHACARRLLSKGFTFKQVGDHLGHRSSGATRVYAKVDLDSLREVAEINLRGLL